MSFVNTAPSARLKIFISSSDLSDDHSDSGDNETYKPLVAVDDSNSEDSELKEIDNGT
jgi:hypothetical protein